MDKVDTSILVDVPSLHDGNFIFIPCPGTIGDAILAYSAYQLFDSLKLDYTISTCNEKFKNKKLIIGGGGNLIGGLYHELQNFIDNNIAYNDITIFPHTVYNKPRFKKWIQEYNLKIFCREPATHAYLNKLCNNICNSKIFLFEDMSTLLNVADFSIYQNIEGHGIGNCFRADSEASGFSGSTNNLDICKILNGSLWHNKFLCHHAVHFMASYLSQFKFINTDRLHTAILASIINRKVNLYTGTYHKIRSIYEFSIKKRWKNISLIN